MKIKHLEFTTNFISAVITVVDIYEVISNSKDEIEKVLEITADISANLEGYADSRELFWYIASSNPITEARLAAADLYDSLSSKAKMAILENELAWGEKKNAAEEVSIILLLEGVLNLNLLNNFLVSVAKEVISENTVKNCKIIAIDALCDAVEAFSGYSLVKVGSKSYSPRIAENSIITDRYIKNLLQLRIIGEMYMNHYFPKDSRIFRKT